MKPTIFLSHSKADKVIIEKIANDLHYAKVNVWYDDWEIPTGVSFRKQIFEEGIPKCDLFFVYLTKYSIESYWVKRELDAAFIIDSKSKGGYIALFTSEESIRSQLSVDLQSLQCPILNMEEYTLPLFDLISKAWDCFLKRNIEELRGKHKLEVIELKQQSDNLRLKIDDFQNAGKQDVNGTIEFLKKSKIELYERERTYYELFSIVCKNLAVGIAKPIAFQAIDDMFPAKDKPLGRPEEIYDFYGLLRIHNIIKIDINQETDDWLYLTEHGSQVSKKILNG